MLQRLYVLGSTGSIGDVARNSDAFVVYALSAHRSMRKLFQQCLKYHSALAIGSEHRHTIELQAARLGRTRTELLIRKGLWHRARPK
ncbi:hypothetical protein [Pseudomonas frederiksbergensis]|uniref:hypothetical protein n=1 Tax=Pseudomonas frederiksbergensis TaxID=104087 RepID=UPI003D99D188